MLAQSRWRLNFPSRKQFQRSSSWAWRPPAKVYYAGYRYGMGESKSRTRRWIIASTAVVVVAAVGITFALVQISNMNKLTDFIAALTVDPTVSLSADLTRDDYQATLDHQCGLIADGWTLEDAESAAVNNWPAVEATSKASREQFIANGVGMLRAAQGVC